MCSKNSAKPDLTGSATFREPDLTGIWSETMFGKPVGTTMTRRPFGSVFSAAAKGRMRPAGGRSVVAFMAPRARARRTSGGRADIPGSGVVPHAGRALLPAVAGLRGLAFPRPGRRGRDQLLEPAARGRGHVLDPLLEDRGVRLRRRGEAADLPHELTGRGADFVLRDRRREVVESADAATHAPS